MLLVAEQDVVQQGAVRGQERAGHFERLCVPELRLVGLRRNIELLEAAYLFLELDDEADLSADAEVADAEEADRLKKSEAVKFLLVTPQRRQILQLHRSDLHDVADIEGKNPL